LERGGSSVVGRGLAGLPDHDQQRTSFPFTQHLQYHSLSLYQRYQLDWCNMLSTVRPLELENKENERRFYRGGNAQHFSNKFSNQMQQFYKFIT
jgi:hypothetical protein